MSLRHIRDRDIEESDLQVLIESQTSEKKLIEFKEILSVDTPDQKKELLGDVSSFANASGGDLVFGMKATEGRASEVCGFEIGNVDDLKLRLENILRDGLDPRIPGLSIQPVPLQSSRHALVIRIPASLASPHMIKFQDCCRFYSRNSAGKYILDTSQLRQAFSLSETLTKRIRDFRIDRFGKIVSGETPVMLGPAPTLVVHLVPLHAFDPVAGVDLSLIADDHKNRCLILEAGVTSSRYNFEGLLIYSHPVGSSIAYSYTQIFRNGSIEAVDTYLMGASSNAGKILDPNFENDLLIAIPRFLSLQKKLGVELPIVLMLTLQGVAGFTIHRAGMPLIIQRPSPIDKSDLLVPDILLEDFEPNLDSELKPAFDMIWNASGWERSMSYDKSGKRVM